MVNLYSNDPSLALQDLGRNPKTWEIWVLDPSHLFSICFCILHRKTLQWNSIKWPSNDPNNILQDSRWNRKTWEIYVLRSETLGFLVLDLYYGRKFEVDVDVIPLNLKNENWVFQCQTTKLKIWKHLFNWGHIQFNVVKWSPNDPRVVSPKKWRL